MDFERQAYEVLEKRMPEYHSDLHRERIGHICAMIPSDVSSLLDAGCGNGAFVNQLHMSNEHDLKRICAIDRSDTALRFVETEKRRGQVEDLPFRDGEFDMVTCLEVLEHLPHEVYPRGLREIERVASRYVLVSVPYCEDLDLNKVKCGKCGTEFSPFYHMRSFNVRNLGGLYEESSLELVEMRNIVTVRKPRFARLKRRMKRGLCGEHFPPICICPLCGYHELDKLRSRSVKTIEKKPPSAVARKVIGRLWPHYSEPAWIAALFRKVDAG